MNQQQQQEETLKKYIEGKELKIEGTFGGFTVQVYGDLNMERLVKRLLKSKAIVGHSARNHKRSFH